MLANLITVIMMALGVASGTQATGNTFYDAKSPQPKKAREQVTIAYEDNFTNAVQSIYGSRGNSNKMYLGYNSTTPSYNTPYANIYNTLYEYYEEGGGAKYTALTFVFRIDNYSDSTMNNLSLNVNLKAWSNANYDVNLGVRLSTYASNEIETYINRTLTDSGDALTIYQQVRQIETTDQQGFDSTVTPSLDGEHYIVAAGEDININEIPAHSNLNVSFTVICSSYSELTLIRNNFIFRLQGYIDTASTTIEVVDVPNIMYTILTMPFSFISTAFNLTIFPGTPYALNFGNLFLTIVAIFILLWLIKKVFH